MKALISSLALLLTAQAASADLLTLAGGPTSKEDVNISVSATENFDKAATQLTTMGSGVRKKAVVFEIPVYVAQLLVSDKSRFVYSDSGALPSFDNEKIVAIRMTFVRDVPISKIVNSFNDGLIINKVSIKDPEVVKFMAMVTKAGDAQNTGSLTLYFQRTDDGKVTVVWENIRDGKSNQMSIVSTPTLMRQLLSIWFGIPAEQELQDLKNEILTKPTP